MESAIKHIEVYKKLFVCSNYSPKPYRELQLPTDPKPHFLKAPINSIPVLNLQNFNSIS